jgi:hypothetical protein
LKLQRRRFGHPASAAERQVIDEMMTEARQKFAVRMLKNPTLGVKPDSYMKLPKFIKNHCRNIAWRLRLSRTKIMSRASSQGIGLIPASFNPDQAEQNELVHRIAQFIETQLTSEQRSVADCRWFKRLTIAETSAALRMTPSQVKTREKQARVVLMEHFQSETGRS